MRMHTLTQATAIGVFVFKCVLARFFLCVLEIQHVQHTQKLRAMIVSVAHRTRLHSVAECIVKRVDPQRIERVLGTRAWLRNWLSPKYLLHVAAYDTNTPPVAVCINQF